MSATVPSAVRDEETTKAGFVRLESNTYGKTKLPHRRMPGASTTPTEAVGSSTRRGVVPTAARTASRSSIREMQRSMPGIGQAGTAGLETFFLHGARRDQSERPKRSGGRPTPSSSRVRRADRSEPSAA